MIIEILAQKSGSHYSRIESAVSMINATQHYFHLNLREEERLASRGSPINPRAKCNEFEALIPDKSFILITEDPFIDNWFSHEYRRSSIITLSDWERIYAPPSLKTYLIYQIVQACVQYASDLSEEMLLNLVHEPAVGCMFDLALHKPDLLYGMLAGNLCPICEGQLKTLGMAQEGIDAVRKILVLVRAEAIGQPIILYPRHAFVVMRFTHNDENDNAWRYGIKTGLEAVGFNPVRADDYVESRQLLEKISNLLNKSRLVVTKVDEKNLNVYFELGLAMGLGKDVLLISESTLVLNLPSDLRNWECLTYDKGNYEQLKERVTSFLRQTYSL